MAKQVSAAIPSPLAPAAPASGPNIAIQALASILISIAMTAALMYYALGANMTANVEVGVVWRMGMAISIVAPAFISPLIAYRTAHLMTKLQEAHDRLDDMARRDALTGLLNRRGFQAAAECACARAAKDGAPVGMLMVDIDRFKAINDAHGHDIGDFALEHVARLLRQTLHAFGGLVSRHGGEEFAVLLPGLDLEGTRQVAETVRRACETTPLIRASLRLEVTVSVGAAALSACAAPLNLLLADADRRLYAAKGAGRNCVVATDPEAAAPRAA